MKTNKIDKNELDDSTRAYLSALYKSKGMGYPGVYTDQAAFPLFYLLVGLGLIVLSLAFFNPEWDIPGYVQVGTFVLGVGITVYNWLKLKERKKSNYIGSFIYLDAKYLWEVYDQNVSFTDLTDIIDVDAYEVSKGGGYQSTKLHIKGADDSGKYLELSNQKKAEEFAVFLMLLVKLKEKQESEDDMAEKLKTPIIQTAAVRSLMNEIDDGSKKEFDRLSEIPTPQKADIDENRPRSQIGLKVVSAAILAAIFAALAYNPVSDYVDDEYFFREAKNVSIRYKDPTYLRDYLSIPEFTRHREEAFSLISAYYDEAIEKLNTISKDNHIDKNLYQGIVAILNYLKRRESPVIKVAFEPKIHRDSNKTKLLEGLVERLRSSDDTTLLSMIETKGTAIIGPGETFDSINVKRRQSIIIERLQDSFKNVLSSNIISFKKGDDPKNSEMVISYDIHPTGHLFKYTAEGVTQGLLKSYEITWKMSIQPGHGELYQYYAKSNPQSQLTLRGQPDDPDWAPYAVILVSAFYDFSSKIIKGFGLTPSMAPDSFTFDEVAGEQQ